VKVDEPLEVTQSAASTKIRSTEGGGVSGQAGAGAASHFPALVLLNRRKPPSAAPARRGLMNPPIPAWSERKEVTARRKRAKEVPVPSRGNEEGSWLSPAGYTRKSRRPPGCLSTTHTPGFRPSVTPCVMTAGDEGSRKEKTQHKECRYARVEVAELLGKPAVIFGHLTRRWESPRCVRTFFMERKRNPYIDLMKNPHPFSKKRATPHRPISAAEESVILFRPARKKQREKDVIREEAVRDRRVLRQRALGSEALP